MTNFVVYYLYMLAIDLHACIFLLKSDSDCRMHWTKVCWMEGLVIKVLKALLAGRRKQNKMLTKIDQ